MRAKCLEVLPEMLRLHREREQELLDSYLQFCTWIISELLEPLESQDTIHFLGDKIARNLKRTLQTMSESPPLKGRMEMAVEKALTLLNLVVKHNKNQVAVAFLRALKEVAECIDVQVHTKIIIPFLLKFIRDHKGHLELSVRLLFACTQACSY